MNFLVSFWAKQCRTQVNRSVFLSDIQFIFMFVWKKKPSCPHCDRKQSMNCSLLAIPFVDPNSRMCESAQRRWRKNGFHKTINISRSRKRSHGRDIFSVPFCFLLAFSCTRIYYCYSKDIRNYLCAKSTEISDGTAGKKRLWTILRVNWPLFIALVARPQHEQTSKLPRR